MVNYGTAALGNKTVSTDEVEANPYLEYENLTINAGQTYTPPTRTSR